MNEAVLECRGVSKEFRDGSNVVKVLESIDLHIAAGETVAILGASGSGKTTLLNLLGGLDAPTAGEVLLAGQSLAALDEVSLCRWRNQRLGFVYQFHHLLPEFSAVENVAMPLLIGGHGRETANRTASALLDRVGLSHRLSHRPAQLSGGERQRVAIARALVADPDVVLMDEPTGNLDPASAAQVLSLIRELSERDSAFVIVTHDSGVAAQMSRRLLLEPTGLRELQ